MGWGRVVAGAAGVGALGVGAVVALAASWAFSHPGPVDAPLPDSLVAVTSAEGAALLDGAVRADFDVLDRTWQGQERPSWCGVASGVAVLNALDGGARTQPELFTPEAAAVQSAFITSFGGMTLDTFGALMDANGMNAAVHHAEDESADAFRARVQANLADSSDFLVVNFLRTSLDQQGGGHFSPIAAYDPDTDRLLVLDTADYKYPAFWVTVDDLWASMDTVDSASGRSRGYAVVGR